MTKLIRFPVDVGRRIAEAAQRERRTFTAQLLLYVERHFASEDAAREAGGGPPAQPQD